MRCPGPVPSICHAPATVRPSGFLHTVLSPKSCAPCGATLFPWTSGTLATVPRNTASSLRVSPCSRWITGRRMEYHHRAVLEWFWDVAPCGPEVVFQMCNTVCGVSPLGSTRPCKILKQLTDPSCFPCLRTLLLRFAHGSGRPSHAKPLCHADRREADGGRSGQQIQSAACLQRDPASSTGSSSPGAEPGRRLQHPCSFS